MEPIRKEKGVEQSEVLCGALSVPLETIAGCLKKRASLPLNTIYIFSQKNEQAGKVVMHV